jgi:hypothetical protein
MLIRLMWVWRDVLDARTTIYLRKIRDGVELDEFEPHGCMAFIVANLAQIDPVGPWMYEALERQLQELKDLIPERSLLRTASRAN